MTLFRTGAPRHGGFRAGGPAGRRRALVCTVVAVLTLASSSCSSNPDRHSLAVATTTTSAAPTPPVSPTAVATTSPPTSPPTTHGATTTTVGTAPPVTAAGCVALSGWSVARLAAETVAVPAEETDVAAARDEVAAGAGGVVLFGSWAPADLGAQLAGLRAAVPGGTGLWVMTDEEGGGIQRMANLVGSLPWPSYMGAYWSPARIRAEVYAVAARMAADGVNMDLAPVVDVDGRNVAPGSGDPDGWRSFSGSVPVVTADGSAFASGLEAGGVTPVLKHFPGLGGTTANSDDGPADTLPWSTLQRSGLPPFEAGVADGVPAVMVSNDVVPGLTTVPASLSAIAVSQVLQGQLHFRGLVITDSLSAKAIAAAGYSVPAAAVQALRAGADMVMFTIGSQFDQIVGAVVSAVAGGSLSRSRLTAAAAAVLGARHVPLCG